MSLGNYFPANYARMQIERQLQPGVVVKFEALMDDGKVHEKRFVVLDVSQDTFTCVINSEVSLFISSKPHMVACQVVLDLASHPFMSRDSQIDCSRIRTYSREDIIDQLCANPDWVLGDISKNVLAQMATAISTSKLISKSQAVQCCAAIQKVVQE